MKREAGISMCLLGFTIILFELLITRIFSAVFSYHFSFMAVSLALFGLGIGGIYHQKLLGKINMKEEFPVYLDKWGMGLALSIFIFNAVNFLIPISFYSSFPRPSHLIFVFCCATVPFFFGGLMTCCVFHVYRENSGRIYFFNLLGSAIACIVTISVLNSVGPVYGLFLASILAIPAGSIFLSVRDKKSPKSAFFMIVIAGVALLNLFTSFFKMDYVSYYGLGRKPDKADFEIWNAFSHVSIIERKYHIQIIIDSEADTWVFPKNMEPFYPSAIPFSLRPGGDFTVIGAGGCADVRCGLKYNPKSIDCVEINPLIIELMKGPLADFSGNIYERPGVTAYAQDGRYFMEKTKKLYDVCVLTLVDSWASISNGAYALTENNLYTMESIDTYLSHLKPDGILTISRWGFENIRLLSMIKDLLIKRGVSNPENNIVVLAYERIGALTVLVKTVPFTAEEIRKIETLLARKKGYKILYTPLSANPDSIFDFLKKSRSTEELAKASPLDLSFSTDNRPFFFLYWNSTMKPSNTPIDNLKIPWLSPPNDRLKDICLGNERAIRTPRLMLYIIFFLALVITLFFIAASAKKFQRFSAGLAPSLYFAFLGIGFMVIEICLAQSFTLFLGHPVYAITAIIFTLLVSGAVGSALSDRAGNESLKKAQLCSAGAVVLLAVCLSLFKSSIIINFFSQPIYARFFIVAVILAPLGIVMGMPFPLGLRRLNSAPSESVSMMWAINGAASVLGSVTAVICAILYGFSTALIIGALFYCAAFLMTVLQKDS